MAELSWLFFLMHRVMRPFGSRIKYDTHSWDQTEDVAGSVFRLSSRVRPRLALSQPSQPPRAELHVATSHHTNISPKPGFASDRHSPTATSIHLEPQPTPCHPLCRTSIPHKHNPENPPFKVALSATERLWTLSWAGRDAFCRGAWIGRHL